MNTLSLGLYNNSYQCQLNNFCCSFKGKKPEKLIQMVLDTTNNKNVKLTFDEATKIYQHLGYDVLMKRGSHAIVPLTATKNIPLVIPHGDKNISPYDVKRLRFVIGGDIDKALTCT